MTRDHVRAGQAARAVRRFFQARIFVDQDGRHRKTGLDVRVLHAVMELAVELVAADAGEIVALLVEEQRLEQLLGVVRIFGLAGTQLLVDLLQRVFAGLDVLVFVDRVAHERAAVEQRQDRFVGFPVEAEVRTRQGADERRNVDLAVLVDANADRAFGLVVLGAVVGLELDPRTAVRNDRRVERGTRVRVDVLAVINARRTDELAHDHALGAVDHERALVRHEREIAHEDLLVRNALDFARLGGDQADADAQRGAVRHVAFAALFNCILRIAERMLAEFEDQVPGEVLDRANRIERLGQTLGLEPLEAGLLQFDEIRDFEDVRDLRERVPIALGTRIRGLIDRKGSRGHRERGRHDFGGAVLRRRCRRAFRLALRTCGALRRGLRSRRFRH